MFKRSDTRNSLLADSIDPTLLYNESFCTVYRSANFDTYVNDPNK